MGVDPCLFPFPPAHEGPQFRVFGEGGHRLVELEVEHIVGLVGHVPSGEAPTDLQSGVSSRASGELKQKNSLSSRTG